MPLMQSAYLISSSLYFKMGVERANLEDVIGNLAYALVEVTGIFLLMEARCMGLEACY